MKTYPELKTMDWYHNLILERNEDGSITEEQFDAYLERYKHIFINDKIFSDYMYPYSILPRYRVGTCRGYLGNTYQLLEKEFPFYGFHTVEKLLVDDELQDLPAKSRL